MKEQESWNNFRILGNMGQNRADITKNESRANLKSRLRKITFLNRSLVKTSTPCDGHPPRQTLLNFHPLEKLKQS